MSDSLSTKKWSAILHAIAITSALAVISGATPSSLIASQSLQTMLQASFPAAQP